MKHLKLSAMKKIQEIKITPEFKKIISLTCFCLFFSISCYCQLADLETQMNNAATSADNISQSIFKIVKICAGVVLIITALSFLYLRTQESDLTKKVGNAVIGIAIFYMFLTIAENFTP